jgi:hypothetical protein
MPLKRLSVSVRALVSQLRVAGYFRQGGLW